MKYEINSTWTRMRSKDIEKLNEILDDEYCVEMEIGRKLSLMKVCRTEMENAIKDFNFEIVIAFMKKCNWVWAYTEEEKITHKQCTPSRVDFEKYFEECFRHALFRFIENGENIYHVESGGIIFYLHCRDILRPSNHNTYCSISFDISQLKRGEYSDEWLGID